MNINNGKFNFDDTKLPMGQEATDTFSEKEPSSLEVKPHSMGSGERKSIDDNITPRLKQLVAVAEKLQPYGQVKNKVITLKSIDDSVQILRKALSLDEDIRDRLFEIASQTFHTPQQQCRQLQDMQLYLTLLNSHVSANDSSCTADEKKELKNFVEGVRNTLDQFKQVVVPEWTTHFDALENVIKNELPTSKHHVQINTLLDEYKGDVIDNRTFAHVLLESLIKGSSALEGNNQASMLSFLKNFLEKHKSQYQNMDGFLELLHMIKDADAFMAIQKDQRFYTFHDYKSNFLSILENFHQALRTKVQSLKNGEKTLVPIGWCHKIGGHAMEMGIERLENGTLRLVIYNLGAGIETYHSKIKEHADTLYQPFLDIINIDEQKLLDKDFTQALLEIQQVCVHPLSGKDTDYGARDIYGLIIKGLGGTVVSTRGERKDFMPPQFSGVCTWASLVAVMHTHLALKDYHKLLSDIAIECLCVFFNTPISVKAQAEIKHELMISKIVGSTDSEKKQQEILNRTAQLSTQMLTHALSECARIALEAYHQGGISQDRLQEIHATLRAVKDYVVSVTRQQDHKEQTEEVLTIAHYEALAPQQITVRGKLSNATAEAELQSPSKDTVVRGVTFEWLENAALMDKGLSDLVQHMSRLAAIDKNSTERIRILETFFRLQGKEGHEKIWDLIPEDQIAAVMVKLADLAEYLLDAFRLLPSNSREYEIYARYMHAVSHRLAVRSPELKALFADKPNQPPHDTSKTDLDVLRKQNDESLLYSIDVKDEALWDKNDRALLKKLQLMKIGPTGDHISILYSNTSVIPSCKLNYKLPWGSTSRELQFIDAFLAKTPDLKDKLKPLLPNVDTTSHYSDVDYLDTERDWQVAFALADLHGKVLPSAFCAWRRINLIKNLSFYREIPELRASWNIHLQKNQEGYYKDQLSICLLGKYDKHNNKFRDFSSEEAFKAFKECMTVEMEWLEIQEQNVMLKPLEDWQRELKLIVSYHGNEGQFGQEQQVINAVSYFSTHLDKLVDHEWRMLCRYLLFNALSLEIVLDTNPHFYKVLQQFVSQGWKHFIERDDVPAAVFFIELARNFESLNDKIKIFDDVRNKCSELLLRTIDGSDESYLIYQQIAASYETHPPVEFGSGDAVLLLRSLYHIKNHKLTKYKTTENLKDQIERVQWRWTKALEDMLKGPAGSAICHDFFATVYPMVLKQSWDCISHYPLCVSQDGQFAIHVKNVSVSVHNVLLQVNFADTIPGFKRVFAQENYNYKIVEGNVWEFNDEHERLHRIDVQNKIILQKQDNGQWYQHIDEGILNIPSQDLRNLLKNSILWVPSENTENPEILVKDSRGQTTHRFCSVNVKLTDKMENFFRQKNKPIPRKIEVRECQKLDVPDAPWHLVTVNREKNPHLSTLFGEGMLWQDLEGKLRELELVSRGLSFEMKLEGGGWQAHSREYPGFYVAPLQRFFGMKPVKGAILLESKEGKRKLVVPIGKIVSARSGSLERNFNLFSLDKDKKIQNLAYDLDKLGRPIAVQKMQQLYLAALFLAQKQYDQAQALIRASHSLVLPYTKEEENLLYEIVLLVSEMHDRSPHAGAVACTALALLSDPQKLDLDNDIQKLERLKQTLRGLGEAYISYKNQEGVVPHLKLQVEEEKKAASYLCQAILHLMSAEQKMQKKLMGRELGYNTELMNVFMQISDLAADEVKSKIIIPHGLKLDAVKSSNEIFVSREMLRELGTMICQSGEVKANLNDYKMLTRLHKSHLYSAFYDMYARAYAENSFMDVFFSAAFLEAKGLEKELLTVLRSTAYCRLHPENATYIFPPEPEELLVMIIENKVDVFTRVLKAAREIEKKMAAGASKEKVAPEIKGKVSAYARSQEAQIISLRQERMPSDRSKKLPERPDLLKKKQLAHFKPIPNGGLRLEAKEVAELNKAIAGPGASKNMAYDALQRVQHIEKYWSQAELSVPWHRISTDQPILTTKTLLMVEYAQMGKEVDRLELEMLDFANDLSDDDKSILLYEVEKMGHLRQPVNIRDILIFTARASHFSLSGKNPRLAKREKQLLDMSLRYLQAKAQQQQLSRAINAYKELEEIDPNDNDAYSRCSEKCWQELNRRPPYKAHEHPELLVFEVMEEVGLHDWQVKDLIRMLEPAPGENSNIIVEKVMGSGKTKVYLPIIALSKADGEHLSLIVVHSSQYASVAQAMQIKSGQNFAQVAHALNFSRESDTSLDALTRIRDECLRVIKQRHFIVATDKSLHSLSLAFSELWDSYLTLDNDAPILASRIEMMREILNLLKTKGKATLDEADLLLNCRFEVVYSMGLPEPINPLHANIVADLYRAIDNHLKQLKPFTKLEYEAMKPQMMEVFVEEVIAQQMPHLDQTRVLDYLKEGQKGIEYVAKLREDEKDVLAIAYYEFKELLPIVLERRCGEHYGYSNDPQKILPVPYVASGVPSPTAEFSFPYALLGYTVQTLKTDGINALLLKRLVQDMQKQAMSELRVDSSRQLQDTQGYKAFLDLCGIGTSYSINIPFLRANDNDIAKLEELYKAHPPDIYSFAKKYIFPAVRMHTRKLTSTPYALFQLFKETQGFTGTPWNYHTFPQGIETLRDINSAGKTEGIMWKNSQTVHDVSAADFKSTVSAIAQIQAKDKYHAFIDVGAIFNGIDNETVAKALLATLPPSIKGILFFKDNAVCILEKGKNEPIRYEGQDTKNLYIFYDQWHTTGTDFPIAGKSLLSIGKNTKMRDLEQGYMRDRKAAQGKRVEFILSKECHDFIVKELNQPSGHKVSTADILRVVEINQERELNDQLVMAALGKLKEVVHQHVLAVQLNPAVSPAVIKQKAHRIQKLIGDANRDAPYEDLGCSRKDETTSQTQPASVKERFFKAVIEQAIEKMKEFMADEILCPKGLTPEALRKELWACIENAVLPDQISSTSAQAPNQLVEQQSLQQSQQERMALVNKELLSDQEIKNIWGPIRWDFHSTLKTYQRSFYHIMTVAELGKQISEFPRVASFDGPNAKMNAPFLSVSDVLGSKEGLREFADVFDIEASYNFLPIVGYASKDTQKELSNEAFIHTTPFKHGQLEVKNVLICKDLKTGEVQVRLLSQGDAAFFFNYLSHITPEEFAAREVEATLYNMTLKTLQSNNEDIVSGKKEVVDDTVLRKLVQAKFFNGESIYSKNESLLLSAWIREKGPHRMKRLFLEHILPYKAEEKQKEYSESILSNIFAQYTQS